MDCCQTMRKIECTDIKLQLTTRSRQNDMGQKNCLCVRERETETLTVKQSNRHRRTDSVVYFVI